MSAKLDAKSLAILVRQIANVSEEHALVLTDIERCRQIIRLLSYGSLKIANRLHIGNLRSTLEALEGKERQLLEHREALMEQLRS